MVGQPLQVVVVVAHEHAGEPKGDAHREPLGVATTHLAHDVLQCEQRERAQPEVVLHKDGTK